MSTPAYKKGERVRFLAEGTVAYVRHAPCEAPHPGALTIAVPLEGGGTYDVTVPLGAVTIERLAPDVQPGQVWRDATGVELWAYRSTALGEVVLRDGDGALFSWQGLHADVQRGPITRVYPLPAVADAPQPEADEPRAPRLMRGDVWGDGDGNEWKVVEQDGRLLLLTWDGETRTWESADSLYGPLTLIERAGHRRTEDTVPVWQLKLGQVVSYPGWADGAPVRFFSALDDVRDLKITCRPLGWISKITVPAARDAEVTLWDEIAGGAR